LAATISYLFHKHKQTYGSPRVTADLRDMGWQVSPNTVAALMREQGLVARRKRRRHGTTKPDKSARKAPDLLRRDFSPREAPNVAWVGDLTEIPTDEGKLHRIDNRPAFTAAARIRHGHPPRRRAGAGSAVWPSRCAADQWPG